MITQDLRNFPFLVNRLREYFIDVAMSRTNTNPGIGGRFFDVFATEKPESEKRKLHKDREKGVTVKGDMN